MNRKEAFSAIMDGKKVQPANWATAGWYLELGGVGINAGDAPDQVMMVVNATDKRAYTHWPDIVYNEFEVAVPITGAKLGNAIASEGAKAGLSTTQVSSLTSGLKSALGL